MLKFRQLFGGRFFGRDAAGSEQRLEVFPRFRRSRLALPCVELVFATLRRRCADKQRGNMDGAIAGSELEAREAIANVFGRCGKAAGIAKDALSLG